MPAAPRTRASLSAGTRPVAAIRSATSSASALIGGALPPSCAPPGGVALPGSVPGARKFGGRSVSIYPSFEVSAGGTPGLMPRAEGLQVFELLRRDSEGPGELLGLEWRAHAHDCPRDPFMAQDPREGDLGGSTAMLRADGRQRP